MVAIILKTQPTTTFLCNGQVLVVSRRAIGICATVTSNDPASPSASNHSSGWLQHSLLQKGRARNWPGGKMKYLGKISWFKINWDLSHQAFCENFPIFAHLTYILGKKHKTKKILGILISNVNISLHLWLNL